MALIDIDPDATRADAGVVPLVGYAQFDDSNGGSGGKAFLPDGEVIRFGQVHDLPSAMFWISNLGFGDQPLLGMRNLRCAGFLGATVGEIARDLGLPVQLDGRLPDGSAAHVAGVMDRTLRAAAEAYGTGSAFRWVHGLRGDYLYQDIARAIPRGPLSAFDGPARRRDVFGAAYQARSVPRWAEWPLRHGTQFVTLRFNRLAYARQLLQMPVPVGKNWVHIEGTAGADLLAEMLARPCLIRADLTPKDGLGDPTPVTLAAIGLEGGRTGRRRGWFAQPELASLAEFMEVTAHGFVADDDGMRPLPARAQLPTSLTERPERTLSYASGLVAHSHLLALATPRQVADRDVAQIDIWSVWLRAMDRSLMHEVALRAHRDGLHVEGFGEGSLVLSIQDDEIEKAKRFWELEGFHLPAGGIGRVN